MFACENCGTVHQGTYGSGRFCSSVCARGFSTKNKRAEINERVSQKLKGVRPNSPAVGRGFTQEAIQKGVEASLRSRQKQRTKRVAELSFEELSYSEKRERILLEQNGKCVICSIDPVWNGKELKFQLDHINGDRENNERNNLRLICPNCHSQTDTFCSKNMSAEGKERHRAQAKKNAKRFAP